MMQGRWTAQKTAKVYIKEGLAILAELNVPDKSLKPFLSHYRAAILWCKQLEQLSQARGTWKVFLSWLFWLPLFQFWLIFKVLGAWESLRFGEAPGSIIRLLVVDSRSVWQGGFNSSLLDISRWLNSWLRPVTLVESCFSCEWFGLIRLRESRLAWSWLFEKKNMVGTTLLSVRLFYLTSSDLLCVKRNRMSFYIYIYI